MRLGGTAKIVAAAAREYKRRGGYRAAVLQKFGGVQKSKCAGKGLVNVQPLAGRFTLP